ncbi:hypothetical protein [Calidithermus roseus]|uniref:Uncharacterized protein n=1 Tax=Calidithermus roseus TaxID=1644118 RepID=A0A399EVU3_9DEIN|nr:hypothetical protein [Calidithermus roseus]RIH87556.1 hypothetical protein Mrose_01265 [Calidithermus roseus]
MSRSPLMGQPQRAFRLARLAEIRGLEAGEQSCSKLLYLIGSQGQFHVFGVSDERRTIKGGNDLLPRRLAHSGAEAEAVGGLHFWRRAHPAERPGLPWRAVARAGGRGDPGRIEEGRKRPGEQLEEKRWQ